MWVITNEEQTLFLAYNLGTNTFYWCPGSECAIRWQTEQKATYDTDYGAINDWLNFEQSHLWYVNQI